MNKKKENNPFRRFAVILTPWDDFIIDDSILFGDAPAAEGETEDDVPKTEVVGVRFHHVAKMYYFDPCGLQIKRGMHVIVETADRHEYGKVSMGNTLVPTEKIVQPLKKVVRIANKDDDLRYEHNCEQQVEAYNICVDCISECRLDMKLIDVEYAFDNSKLNFY